MGTTLPAELAGGKRAVGEGDHLASFALLGPEHAIATRARIDLGEEVEAGQLLALGGDGTHHLGTGPPRLERVPA